MAHFARRSPGYDVGGEDFDEDDFYGFTFYIQHREFEYEDNESDVGEDDSDQDDNEKRDDEDDSSDCSASIDTDKGNIFLAGDDERVVELGIKVSESKPLPKAVQRSLKWQDKSAKSAKRTAAGEGKEILFGQLLMDFFSLFGDDFDVNKIGFSVRGGGFTFPLHGDDAPEHPLANDPFIIEDPLNATNNVGRTNYRITMLQSIFSDSLLAIKSGIAGAQKERSEKGNILLNLLMPGEQRDSERSWSY